MDHPESPDPGKVKDLLFTLSETGTPRSGTAGVIDVGTGQFVDTVEKEVVDEYIARGGSTCMFIQGSHGSGKSHILQLIEDRALGEGFVVCRIELGEDLGFERWDQITKHFLENCYIRFGDRHIRNLPRIMEYLGDEGLVDLADFERTQMVHPCFKRAIQHAIDRSDLDEEAWRVLYRYLLGERVLVRDLRDAGLKGVRKSLTQNNAEQVLNTALNSIHCLGFRGVILLFDETDRNWLSSRKPTPRAVRIAANLIRRFIDSCSTGEIHGTLAVFAVLPNFIRDCMDCYPALGQRLEFQRENDGRIAWRWPILPVNGANSLFMNIDDPFEQRRIFLDNAKVRFRDLVEICGGTTDGIEEEFEERGLSELKKWAGEEYKRAIIKILASLSIARIDEGDVDPA